MSKNKKGLVGELYGVTILPQTIDELLDVYLPEHPSDSTIKGSHISMIKEARADLKQQLLELLEEKVTKAIYDYTDHLNKRGYIDSDYYTEEPDPRQEFLNHSNIRKLFE